MSAEKKASNVRLVVSDEAGVLIRDERANDLDAADVFREMNYLCGFAEWKWAHVNTRITDSTAYTGSESEERVKSSIQRAIDRMPSTNPGEITLSVRKRDQILAEGPDDRPEGPDAPRHPGVGPHDGPNWKWQTAPKEGPEPPPKAGAEPPRTIGSTKGTLARMRGLLGPNYGVHMSANSNVLQATQTVALDRTGSSAEPDDMVIKGNAAWRAFTVINVAKGEAYTKEPSWRVENIKKRYWTLADWSWYLTPHPRLHS